MSMADGLPDRHGLFGLLPEAVRQRLLDGAMRRTFAVGERLIVENGVNEALFLLRRGSVRVVMNGTEIGTLGEGDIVGEISTSGISPPVATVIAGEEVEAVCLPIAAIQPLAAEFPEFGRRLTKLALNRIAGRG